MVDCSPEFAEYIKNMKPPEDKYIIVDFKDGQPVYAKAIAAIPASEDMRQNETIEIRWSIDFAPREKCHVCGKPIDKCTCDDEDWEDDGETIDDFFDLEDDE